MKLWLPLGDPSRQRPGGVSLSQLSREARGAAGAERGPAVAATDTSVWCPFDTSTWSAAAGKSFGKHTEIIRFS